MQHVENILGAIGDINKSLTINLGAANRFGNSRAILPRKNPRLEADITMTYVGDACGGLQKWMATMLIGCWK